MRDWVLGHRFLGGVAVGIVAASLVSLVPRAPGPTAFESSPAPRHWHLGSFVSVVIFPSVLPGQEAAFLDWFEWSNGLYRSQPGFRDRLLLRAIYREGTYAAVVEHDSMDSMQALQSSPAQEEAMRRVEPLLEGRPTARLYEVVRTAGQPALPLPSGPR